MSKVKHNGKGAVKDVNLSDVLDLIRTGSKILKDLLKPSDDKKK